MTNNTNPANTDKQSTQKSENKNLFMRLAPIRKGLLEYEILKIIESTETPPEHHFNGSLYAKQLLEKLEKTDFIAQEGTIYPHLSKMRKEKLIEYHWEESNVGPPRKYYYITDSGRRSLREITDFLKKLIEPHERTRMPEQ